MPPLKDIAERLAYQVDRKILDAEEADHLRLDLPAEGRMNWASLVLAKPSLWSTGKRFAISAVAIYLLLFAVTNAPAYSKWVRASVKDSFTEETTIASEDTLAIDTSTPGPDGLPNLAIAPTTYENRIEIPSLYVNAPIVLPELGVEALQSQDWNELESQIRQSLLQGVAHYPGTAEPGERGNFFLTGHSSNVFWESSEYNTVFALLPKIEIGDEILITYNQQAFTYRVTEKKEVSPRDVSVLKQGRGKTMTLMTCTPVGTTLKRLVVTAELVED